MSERPSLRHFLFDTYQEEVSFRDEVSDASVATMKVMLQKALKTSGTRVPIPGREQFTLAAASGPGNCIVAHVRGPSAEKLVRFGIAHTDRASDYMWQVLTGTLRHRDDRTPTAPWYASLPLDGIARHPSAALWLPSLMLTCAWAWLEVAPP